MDEPLDFELELLRSSPPPAKKRKKLIGLDDLVVDFYKEKKERLKKKTKQPKAKKNYNSDEEQDEREAALSKYVDDCEKQICEIRDDPDISLWGLQVFGNQNALPSFTFPETESCLLLKSFVGHHLHSIVEFDAERGGCSVEGLLADGWLSKMVHACGQVEKSIGRWTFHLMLYSSEEMLRASAFDFWSDILMLKNESEQGNLPCIKIDWLPSFSELREALQVYGFLMFPTKKYSSNQEMGCEGSNCLGPPQNIRAWIKFVAACSRVRIFYSIFSTSEAEDLVVWIICLLLDRQLLGLSMILYECMQSLISSFTNDEWKKSADMIASSLASRIPIDINCLRIVESISGADARIKHLRRTVAFQFLRSCFEDGVPDEEGVLQFLLSITVKDKNCDLFKAYIYLVLTENWLLYNPMLEERPIVKEMWGLYLRNFSCQISSTDLRSYASKIRSKASYLLQGIADK